ncbi:uncharacterized protein LOC124805858 isoform X2 [Hydra vulgaris]|uniref:uncharacterized protein LOC124805858 isoform X2 n=1 Tax=Hydra vulgaris TaxID=6087 RepID=UPI0032E9C7A1
MDNISFSYDKISGDDKSLSLLQESNLINEEKWICAESYEEILALIQNYETETVSKFSCYSADKNFGNIASVKHHKIRWEDDSVPFNGVPFVIVGSKVFDCMHGRDRKVSFKEEYKMRCNDRKIIEDSKWKRVASSKKIREAISKNEAVGQKIFLIFLPSMSSHTGHFTRNAAGISQPIDARLKEEIFTSSEFITSVDEMRRRLEIIVTREIFKNSICPSKSNKRFFPSKKTIRSYMLEAIRKKRYSNIDQECLIKKVEQWKVENPHRRFYLQPKGISENYAVKVECSAVESTEDEDEIVVEALTNSFLFVYQTEEMRRLLKIYGNEITLLDTTYKTTKYSLPLFFLVVKTNVDYQIVGTFICEGESTKNIQSGLAKIKEWNPNWNPLYFMVDCCAEEINAIESLHQECQVLM